METNRKWLAAFASFLSISSAFFIEAAEAGKNTETVAARISISNSNSDRSAELLLNNYVDGPSLRSDSGVKYTPYETMERNLRDLSLKFPKKSELIHYGKSVQGRNLNVLRIEDREVEALRTTPRLAVEISGAIHGNEFLGIEDKLGAYFLENLDKMPGLSLYLATGGVIYVIPVINPDGYSKRKRGNANGSDLNRDFDVLPTLTSLFSQIETQALRDFIESDLNENNLELEFVLDYHCCLPGLITPWTYKNAQPSQNDLATYTEFIALQKSTLGYGAGNAAETVGYNAVGSSLDYFYAKYGTFAFTIEGKNGGEDKEFQKHIAFLDSVFKKIALQHLGLEN